MIGKLLCWLGDIFNRPQLHDIGHEDAGGDWGICKRCGHVIDLGDTVMGGRYA